MFRSPRHSVAAFVFLFLFASGVLAFGQGTRASINGAVRDTSGAVVPDAKLNLRSVSTTAVFSVTSAAEGLYDFPNLVAGVYELSVTAKGFREYVQKGITINLDQQVRLDVGLEVGADDRDCRGFSECLSVELRIPGAKGKHTTRDHR